MEEVIFDFTRIFRDPWDTHWWLGESYGSLMPTNMVVTL